MKLPIVYNNEALASLHAGAVDFIRMMSDCQWLM